MSLKFHFSWQRGQKGKDGSGGGAGVFLAAAGVKGKILGAEQGLLGEDKPEVDKALHLFLVNKTTCHALLSLQKGALSLSF